MTPKEIRRLRKRANASQAVFAHHLNVSSKLAQAWEGGYRQPTGAALKLLRIAEANPDLVFDALPETRPNPALRAIGRKMVRRAKKRSLTGRAR
jgi:transcriptional regulator with XRE-family HTH domain